MLQLLEIKLIEFIGFFYSLPMLVGIVTLGTIAVTLLLAQFVRQASHPVYGIFGIFFAIATYFHIKEPGKIIEWSERTSHSILHPDSYIGPVPILEPFFSILVGPYQSRGMFLEVFGITILLYICSWLYHVYQDYKTTGILVGNVSVGSLLSNKPLQQRPKRSLTNELGSADLATTEHIARWTKHTNQPDLDTALFVSDLRGSDGVAFKQAKLIFPYRERNRHILIVAKTGGGKTTKLVLPLLYNDCMSKTRSTIVIDSKPEMWQKLARMTRELNPEKHIIRFNPLDMARSLSWNILGKIHDETDCKLIANTVIMATDPPAGTKSDSPFFRNNALAILNSVMVGLLHDKDEVLSMPRIHELIQSGMQSLCNWLEAHPHALRNTRTFVELARSGSQNADTIMSELSMRLSAWDIPAIAATTFHEELDLRKVVDEPTLFIIELRESELEMLRPLANVMVVEILRFLTKEAENSPNVTLKRPVSIVIDEFASSIGRLPDIHVKLNTLRSRNISIVAAIQSTAQIKANYESHADSVLAGFSTKIFMPPLEQQDSELASKDTGQMTIRYKTESAGSNRKIIEWFASRNVGTQEQVQQRAVLTADEIGRPPDSICTFFMPDTPVFQGHLIPYYKIPEMIRTIERYEKMDELLIRDKPIEYEDKLPTAGSGGGAATQPGGLPAGISNTKGWSEEQTTTKLEETKKKLDWENTTGSARKWWEAFENENKHRIALVLRLAEELSIRNATITEFFLAYVYSNTDNIQANLHYLDYTRLKKEEEKKRREAAKKSIQGGEAAA